MASFVELTKTDAKSLNFTTILQCMEHRIRIYLQREDSPYFNVSRLVFTVPDGCDLTIKARSNHARQLVTKPGKADQSAAYYAAKTRNVKAASASSRRCCVRPAWGCSSTTAPAVRREAEEDWGGRWR